MRPRLLILWLLGGCATPQPAPVPHPGTVGDYTLSCNDLVRVDFLDRPELNCYASVDLDGSLPLGPLGSAPAAGVTLPELATECARLAGVEPTRVAADLVDPRGQRLYVVGPDRGARRAVAYVGPEPVSSFVRRFEPRPRPWGELSRVTVRRRRVALGLPCQTWALALRPVQTDLVLEPSDEIELHETRLLPDWAEAMLRDWLGRLDAGRED